MSTFHIDEYDEQSLIDSGAWQYKVDNKLVLINDIGEKYITVIINSVPEWRKVFTSKEGCYINIGTRHIEV